MEFWKIIKVSPLKICFQALLVPTMTSVARVLVPVPFACFWSFNLVFKISQETQLPLLAPKQILLFRDKYLVNCSLWADRKVTNQIGNPHRVLVSYFPSTLLMGGGHGEDATPKVRRTRYGRGMAPISTGLEAVTMLDRTWLRANRGWLDVQSQSRIFWTSPLHQVCGCWSDRYSNC